MDTKLTLKLDADIIAAAKAYAAGQGVSLSKIIENYLKVLTTFNDDKTVEEPISEYVKSLSTGKSLPSDMNYKEEYGKHLIEKYGKGL